MTSAPPAAPPPPRRPSPWRPPPARLTPASAPAAPGAGGGAQRHHRPHRRVLVWFAPHILLAAWVWAASPSSAAAASPRCSSHPSATAVAHERDPPIQPFGSAGGLPPGPASGTSSVPPPVSGPARRQPQGARRPSDSAHDAAAGRQPAQRDRRRTHRSQRSRRIWREYRDAAGTDAASCSEREGGIPFRAGRSPPSEKGGHERLRTSGVGVTLVGVVLLFGAVFAGSYAIAHQLHQDHAQAVLRSERAAMANDREAQPWGGLSGHGRAARPALGHPDHPLAQPTLRSRRARTTPSSTSPSGTTRSRCGPASTARPSSWPTT